MDDDQPVQRGWVSTLERRGGSPAVRSAMPAVVGLPITVGFDADLPLGVAVGDRGVSAIAATVTPTRRGWRIDPSNRNGVALQPWGRQRIPCRRSLHVDDDLVGLLVYGVVPDSELWVLLEFRSEPDDPRSDQQPEGPPVPRGMTEEAPAPRPLTPTELATVEAVFADILAWPPLRHPRTPRTLRAAAARLGVSTSAVQNRLSAVRDKAVRLGADGSGELTHPGYVHALVVHGYLVPSHSTRPHE